MMALLRDHRRALAITATLAVVVIAGIALRHLLVEVRYRDIRDAVRALGWRELLPAIGFTAISYLALTGYDVLALRTIGRPLPYRTAAFASFTSYTLSHNLGLAVLTGGSARYRIYTAAGLSAADVARVVAIAALTLTTGMTALFGVALLARPGALRLHDWIAPWPFQAAIGAVLLGGLALYILLAAVRRGQALQLGKWTLPLPSAPTILLQIAVSSIDLAAAAATLFVLVPHAQAAAYPLFFVAYIIALLAALLSHSPGGLGIFETVLLVALPSVPKSELFGALILYRVVYYLLPLVIAAALLAIREGKRWRRPVARALEGARGAATGIAPPFLAALGFLGGAVLLASGTIPALQSRMHDLEAWLPLPFIEASHLAASLTGTALVMLAPGLYRRLDGAFHATRLLLLAGAIFSLTKGFDYEEALVCVAILALLQWTQPAFYRRTTLTAAPLSAGGLASAAIALAIAAWIGFFAYRHVDYDDSLWWSFSLHGNASRFLRATLAASILIGIAAVQRLLAPAQAPEEGEPLPPDIEAAAFAANSSSEAFLALTGDKLFLTAPDAFLMYQVQGRSWVAMGDPIGAVAARADLMWRFKELADVHQGRAVFYQLTPDVLPIAIDMGLQLFKLGEEARVDLATFTTDGPAGKPFRHAARRLTEAGATFEIVPASGVPALLPELQAVSDAWLAGHGSEKHFSLGSFDPAYLVRTPVALVRVGGEIVAFANLWATGDKAELSVDLMRHRPDAPPGLMDYLFSRLMLWGRAEGYGWFNLGMAPLAGMADRRSAPLWPRVGAFLYRHGNDLYGFEGLRAYKDKFGPEWRPRYLASSPGLGFARAMLDITTLISGGRLSAARRR